MDSLSQSAAGALSRAARWWLSRRRPLHTEPSGGLAIKRNVHTAIIDAPVAQFFAAFEATLRDPAARFGPLRLSRLAENVGQPFQVGERFHGTLSVALLLGLSPGTNPWLETLLHSAPVAWAEELWLSDFAELTAITHDPAAGRYGVRYRYLSGCPIAGESDYLLTRLGSNACQLTQRFTFQEQGAAALVLMHAFGLRLHDQVVATQLAIAASRCRAPIRQSTLGLSCQHHTGWYNAAVLFSANATKGVTDEPMAPSAR